MKDYIVIQESNKDLFEAKIKEKLLDGYNLHGVMIVTDTGPWDEAEFFQALTK